MEYIKLDAYGLLSWGLLRFPGAGACAYEKVTFRQRRFSAPWPFSLASHAAG